MTHGTFSALVPVPPAWTLPEAYPRHDPGVDELRAAIDHLAGMADWAGLGWSELVESLVHLGATDIPLGRLVEGHVDAVRILSQAGAEPRPGCRYGVWASRSAGTGVAAVVDHDSLTLDGTIRFASGAGVIDRALVPVWPDTDTHLLVDLDVRELPVDRSHWHTAAMRVSQTHTVLVQDVTVSARDLVGEPGFYLGRPQFLPGGVGVAAVWAGGLLRLLEVTTAAFGTRAPSPAQSIRLGRVRQRLVAALAVVRAAGQRLDELVPANDLGPVDSIVPTLCAESRAVVADAATTAIGEIRTLAGPAALAFDPDLGHALDDLGLYAAQLNADAEAERLGAALIRTPSG